ncbi:phenazine biosynthesis protein PhzF [Actinomadura craniellae]|uniref:Phenazine biosynthesis protein PhzF n=1 Tax=Actinomadura craniellae TaxID=2231787 RepID=A0A365H0J0_9ACTN|nr:PhzF family phenazine biosynthesis protein [Actinomadura craniellae]RAY12602.1 phenazine biosynthesis protein PhzF [Actinomadura craniellae]
MIRFTIVNMFAERACAGSALGVVTDARGLSDERMRQVATALDTDETAFVLPPAAPGATHRVRIFTPGGESPFGGHSCIGTAVTLVRDGLLPAGDVVQECGPGLHRLSADRTRATMSAAGPRPGGEIDPEPLLEATGLARADLAGTARAAGFGPLFHYLPVRDEAVRAARPDLGRMARLDLPDVFVFGWDAARRTAHGRLFAPGYGIPEDPACAGVALGLGLWLVAEGALPADAGTHGYGIDQGAEMGRPARLDCALTIGGDGSVTASVTGRVVPAVRGNLVLPAHPGTVPGPR